MGKFSIGIQILVAVVLGIITGLFFGPLTSSLSPFGSAYTMLLQMAVLPYITFSLIHGLGSITPEIGKKIFKSGWPFFLSLWLFVFFLIFLLVYLIPEVPPPVIYSGGSSQFESQFTKNFLSNLIPDNPFYDVINNVVPAVALFGLITGVALMHVKNKEPLIGALERVNQTIEKILHWLGLLSPIGVFIYIAIAFGNVHFDDLFKMQIYVIAFILSSLFVVLWLLPTLISTLTPISYKEALGMLRYVCLVPFFTGLSTVALPFIANFLKKLSKQHATHVGFRETSQTILPIAYSFGHIGNAMLLFFLFFLSYYYRHPISLVEKTLLSILTIPLSIGSSTGNFNSTLFLLNQLGFPQGADTLFLEIKSFTNNFNVLMSIATVFTLLLLTIYSYYGLIQVKWKELGKRIAIPIGIFALFIFAISPFVRPKNIYENLYMNLTIPSDLKIAVKAELIKDEKAGAPRVFTDPNIPELFVQILRTKVLKVGYSSDSIPFCYFNTENELVGYDIAYAYELARDLGCDLQLIPIDFDRLDQQLNEGAFDIGMSSVIMNESRLSKMEFSTPYFKDNNIVLVERAKKKPFLNLETAQSIRGLKIGAGGIRYDAAKSSFPNAELIRVHSTEQLLKGQIDAILWSETSARIWSLSHPEYVVIDYGNRLGTSYFGYPFRQHAVQFGFFFNNWLTLKDQSGFKDKMKNYWIYGITSTNRPPRWSIIYDVLHWQH